MKLPASFNPYLQYAQKNKGVLLAVVVGLALIVFIYYKGKKAGGDASLVQLKYPNGGKTIRAGFDANGYAIKLYDVMKGLFTWANDKEKVFLVVFSFSDEELIATYNAFNLKYGSEGNGTLTKWIKDEKNITYGSGGVSSKLTTRLISLGAL